MSREKKIRFRGGVTFNLRAEEREFWFRAFKDLKLKDELDERIAKRTLMKLAGKPTHRFPLYSNRECPHCERTFAHAHFDVHVYACKRKQKFRQGGFFEVDPEILERLRYE